MNRRYEDESSNKLTLLAAFVAAVAVVGGGMYLVLQKAAPIAAAPSPHVVDVQPSTMPASEPKASATPVMVVMPRSEHTAFRCMVNGTPTYSNEPCAGGKAVDVTPASSGFIPQRSHATVRVAQAPSTESGSTSKVTSALATEKAARDSRCAWIEAEIERIDGAARQGQSAASQDLLRASRRRLVDEKYALKC